MTEPLVRGAVAALDSGGDPDDILRSIVALIAAEPGVTWAGIAFVEGDALVLGPAAGDQAEKLRRRVPVLYDGDPIAEIWVDGQADSRALERVGEAIAELCLVGWDTGGEPWDSSW